MKQKKRIMSGFTMAELLIVVAIITVLSGVGFIAVQSHQKSLELTERDAIAKEIFIAAQNHLTMAESQGYLDVEKSTDTFGKPDESDGTVGEVWIATSVHGSGFSGTGDNMLDLMLPLGSIDETVRKGGSYIIRYQASPAQVLDVFFWKENEEQSYDALKNLKDADARKKNNPIIGYYGGVNALELATFTISAPDIVVNNAERLTVELTPSKETTENKDNVQIKLIVKGLGSNAMAVIPVQPSPNNRVKETGDVYTVVLDDITESGLQFANLIPTEAQTDTFETKEQGNSITSEGSFVPGENITVQAVAYSNTSLSNIAYSSEWTVNSLFSDLAETTEVEIVDNKETTKPVKTAFISNIRHLENLDQRVSGLDNGGNKLFDKAVQTADLLWQDASAADTGTNKSTAFTYRIFTDKKDDSIQSASEVRVYQLKDTEGTEPGTFLPISPEYALTYDGGIQEAVAASEGTAAVPAKYHSITGVVVGTTGAAYSGDAGLFGAPEKPLAVSNLELIDFDITGSGDAGALAGMLVDDSSVTNVLAHNSDAFEDKKKRAATITSTDGSAGGLIGSMADTTVEKCAAALVVSGKDNAGGLVGSSDGGSVIGCYAGGHAVEKKDGDNVIGVWYGDVNEAGNAYNVTATGTAGGLIGSLGTGSEVKNCYSTCSVKGATAGGFVGKGSSGSLSNSYATGLVAGASSSSKIGAFAGELTARATDCLYFEIVNERVDETTGMISYLPPVPGSETTTGIAALDESATTYNVFTGADGAWTDAEAYDATLAQYYTVGDGLKYNLKSIPRLAGDAYTASGEGMPADFVATHYGDWPAPEIFVINEKSGS